MPRRERVALPERVERDFVAELRLVDALGLELLLAERLLPDFAAADLEREEEDRALVAPGLRELALDLVAAGLRELALDLVELPLPVEVRVSKDHFPLITRLAASATASAISDPSFVALESTDFAALSAVSAASIPASRIAFRALGLALIAAAAAARPAASISLLIAALASFSAVDLEEPEGRELALDDFDPVAEDFDRVLEDLDAVLLLDLAITNLP